MMRVIQNVNTYVENAGNYKSDSVKLELDEDTFRVTLYPADTSGVAIAGANPIVDETCTSLVEGIKYYEKIEQQLSQGDIVRNV